MPEPSEGPTVLRILLGTQLRRLRDSRGITAQEAARAIRGSESKISRIELGRNAIREIDVLDLLTYYGVGAVEREQLLTLAEQANRPGWWHRYNDILPDWFQSYVGMEEAATSIRIYPVSNPGKSRSARRLPSPADRNGSASGNTGFVGGGSAALAAERAAAGRGAVRAVHLAGVVRSLGGGVRAALALEGLAELALCLVKVGLGGSLLGGLLPGRLGGR
jgi:transcriptional regulator with XRE-family HTH domain